ncbi:MAG: lamin tail domain-containing protein [Bacteroidota bacterium]
MLLVASVLLVASLALSPTAHAQLTLAAPGASTAAETFTGFAGAGFAPAPAAGQLDSDVFIAGGLSDGNMQFGDTPTGNDFSRGASTGGVTAGGVYGFDTGGGDVGWGVQQSTSDFNPGYFVVRYQNTTGASITAFTVAYDVYIYNDRGRSNTFDLSYAVSLDDTLLVEDYEGDAVFALASSAQVTSPQAADSSPSWNATPVSVTVNQEVPAGAYLLIRFSTADVGGVGERDEFALDNLVIASLAATVGPAPGDVVVTEFMANPTTGAPAMSAPEWGEYIELYNTTGSALNLDGWELSDDGSDFHTIDNGGSLPIAAGGYLVLCHTQNTALNGGLACDYAYGDDAATDIALAQGQDEIALSDGTTQIFKVDYSSGSPGGAGVSQELRAVSLVPSSGEVVNTRITVSGNGSGTRRPYVDSSTSGQLDADFGSPGLPGHSAISPAAMTLGSYNGRLNDEDIGWYMLSVPSDGMTLAELGALNHIQGVDGFFDDESDAANIYTFYDPGRPDANLSFVEPGTDANDDPGAGSPTDGTDYEFVPGQGFIWYHYDRRIAGAGTALPYTLTATANEPAGPISLTIPGDEFYLSGNPYRASLSLDDVTQTGGSGTLSTVVQVWDPFIESGGGFGGYRVLSTTTPDLVPTWQGFFLENLDATNTVDVAITDSDATGGTFFGRHAASATQPVRRLGFELVGESEEFRTFDGAAFLHFHPDATDGTDRFDGSKLSPLSGIFGTLALVGARDGADVLRAVESRPDQPGDFEIDLDVQSSITGTFTLTWPTWDRVPDSWGFELIDRVTNTRVDLRAADSYTFTSASTLDTPIDDAARQALPASVRMKPSWTQEAARSTGPRFTLVVTTGAVAAEDAARPQGHTLSEVYPNPFASTATVHLSLDAAQAVRAEVYDVLGRRVAVLADDVHTAGAHTFVLDGQRWASGLYLVRVRGEQFVETRRVTLVR